MTRSPVSLSLGASFALLLGACVVTPTQPPPATAPVAPVVSPAPSDPPPAPVAVTPPVAPAPTPAPILTPQPPLPPATPVTPAPAAPADEDVDAKYRACAADTECVAVARNGCCHNGHMVAVAASQKAGYLGSFKCDQKRPICPQYRINDTRTPYCDAASHKCAMK